MKLSAIIPASGQGSRMKSDVAKQYMDLDGKPMLFYALDAFQKSQVDEIILVVPKGEEDYVKSTIVTPYGFTKVKKIIAGGEERYLSVYHGLLAAKDSDYVLIHDGARPLVSQELIARCIETVKKKKACVAAVPVKDTIKQISVASGKDTEYIIHHTLDRKVLYSMQTPQCFETTLLFSAYQKLFREISMGSMNTERITDDAFVVEKTTDEPIYLVEGDEKNIKVTTPYDLMLANVFLSIKA